VDIRFQPAFNTAGVDTRITWQTPASELYGRGISNYRALRFDADRRVLYVA